MPMDRLPRAETRPQDRRDRVERRRRVWWSVWYGSFHPRRRAPTRRNGDGRFHMIDWYSSHLLAVAIGILLLSTLDAFLTLILLAGGADEVNPLMAALVFRSVGAFTAIKMGLTGVSVLALVFASRYRLLRVFRVDALLYVAFIAYASLIGYEIWMLKWPIDLP
jgi:hypothetical protein